jgi:hypothetical protein
MYGEKCIQGFKENAKEGDENKEGRKYEDVSKIFRLGKYRLDSSGCRQEAVAGSSIHGNDLQDL